MRFIDDMDICSISESDDDDDEVEILDPSDPRAHVSKSNVVVVSKGKQHVASPVSHSTKDEKRENVANLTNTSTEDDKKKLLKLSKWASSRFLQPRKTPIVTEEFEVQPLNDFILHDFSTRFRGNDVVPIEEEGEDVISDEEISPNVPTLEEQIQLAVEEHIGNTPNSQRKLKRKNESRYFVEDLTIQCFNCKKFGHMSSQCTFEKVFSPCRICGQPYHGPGVPCPSLLCFKCSKAGHSTKECTQEYTTTIAFCDICGHRNHHANQCSISNMQDIRCLSCGKRGHANCFPLILKTSYCCRNCGKMHRSKDCLEQKETELLALCNDGDFGRSSKMSLSCYLCGKLGHIKMNCPQGRRNGRRQETYRSYGSSGGYNPISTRKPRHRKYPY